MKIQSISNNLNFTSGLNRNALHNCLNTRAADVELFLKDKKIESDFQACNTVAFLTQNVIKILDILKKKTGAKLFNYAVPGISAYTLGNLTFDFTGVNFCIPETRRVLQDKKEFKTGSIFFEQNDDLEQLNYKLDKSYANNERSSSHYLSPYIHEFMHNVYLNYIYSKYGYEGECNYTRDKYFSAGKQNKGLSVLQELQTQIFSEKENKVIENTIGKYATGRQNQYHEVFAETFTKLICDSLSENGTPDKNPVDLIKTLNPDFLLILQKIFV